MRIAMAVIDTASARLTHVADRAERLEPALRGIQDLLRADVADRFRSGAGWPPLDPETLARRRRDGHSGSRVLVASGELMRSLTDPRPRVSQLRSDSLVFGTDVDYARAVAKDRNPLPAVDAGLIGRAERLVRDHLEVS